MAKETPFTRKPADFTLWPGSQINAPFHYLRAPFLSAPPSVRTPKSGSTAEAVIPNQ